MYQRDIGAGLQLFRTFLLGVSNDRRWTLFTHSPFVGQKLMMCFFFMANQANMEWPK